MAKLIKIWCLALLVGAALCGCYELRPTSGGGKLTVLPQDGVRALKPEDGVLWRIAREEQK
ncbi:hypothetical protein GEOBRER4_n3028 [Citrifermentans bremense]|uniref:Uncharacterized protein n=1 Tax=Citrifermentans bremense TaxID=60035 RepID=A0A6S6M9M2_9BACT|nr:hypothetical protein [Citrifermentans bremense]BCG48155.1 hypothetical protein GEOBRER4_n3028 [Citrifermentans bremense]